MGPRDLARLVLLGSIWGSSFLLIKVGLEDLTPLQILLVRVFIGAAVLLAFSRLRGIRFPRRNLWGHLLVMSIVSNLIPFTLIGWGQERIASSMAAILNSTTPLFTALLATALLVDERVNLLRGFGIIVGFLGVAVIVGFDPEGGFTGHLAVVVASASYGVGFVYARAKVSGIASPLSISLGQMTTSTLLALPIAAVDIGVDPPDLGAESALAVTALGVLGTGVAYILYFQLIQDVGATTASFVTYLIPIVGVLLGYVFLDEALGWNAFAGAAMVIAGIALAEKGARVAARARRAEVEAIGAGEPAAGPATE
jgi:drug/metabolite transporter (DMT)-like permease